MPFTSFSRSLTGWALNPKSCGPGMNHISCEPVTTSSAVPRTPSGPGAYDVYVACLHALAFPPLPALTFAPTELNPLAEEALDAPPSPPPDSVPAFPPAAHPTSTIANAKLKDRNMRACVAALAPGVQAVVRAVGCGPQRA